ncbi:hypothetical protein E2562_027953 [Oryza meyeriana var. granulata]|uniref:DUF4220 domain-containing protein n=1 Tax=Oryza meyeriana var. granulata TaxID=110450 RepID=A0A6G1CTW3_9ORYZ|nr:hypothetical protein E2562_027953 [Oryza meyeriana var. granulata]
MGFNPPVPQSDSDWYIRVVVLLSLLLQAILIFVAPMRRRSSHPLTSFAVWSCYLLADWRGPGGGAGATTSGGSPPIFAFWTPFLLLHLGGPDTITAYSLDDNELWLRHLFGLLFELISASVVFFCSLKSNPMIPATILIFVVGIIKYGERTYSLYSGSIDGVLANILRAPDPGPNYAKLMTVFQGKQKAGLLVEISIANGEAGKAQEALEESKVVQLVTSKKSLELMAYDLFMVFRSLCYDIPVSYQELKIGLAYFLERKDVTAIAAFEVVDLELEYLYEMLHTKAPVTHTWIGCGLRIIGTGCLVSAVVLFVTLDKSGVRPVDRGITYALLLGGLVLDAAAFLMLLSSNRMLVFLDNNRRLKLNWLARVARAVRPRTRRWSGPTSHLMNLISYCLDKPASIRSRSSQRFMQALTKAADVLHVRKLLDKLFFIQREQVSRRRRKEAEEHDDSKDKDNVLKYVFDGLKKAAENIKASGYSETKMMDLGGFRGEGTLKHDKHLVDEIQEALTKATRVELGLKEEEEEEDHMAVMEKLDGILLNSVERKFDESLLMWHIATDLCSHPRDWQGPRDAETDGLESISKTLSEYMLYLLVRQPKLLSVSAGAGQMAFLDTCAEARRFFNWVKPWDPDHKDARQMLLLVNTSMKPVDVKGDWSKSVLFDACILAKVLRQLDDDTMWRVVAGVWREMLMYAARGAHTCGSSAAAPSCSPWYGSSWRKWG